VSRAVPLAMTSRVAVHRRAADAGSIPAALVEREMDRTIVTSRDNRGRRSSRRLPARCFPFARFSFFSAGELAVEVADDLRRQRGHLAQMRAADRCQAADQLVRLGLAVGSAEELVADCLRVPVVAVASTAGTLTLYDSDYPKCGPKRFSRGQGFVERRNHVHLARNEGATPVKLYATYLGVPQGAPPNKPASRPENCPA
jgi:hypothetical protein